MKLTGETKKNELIKMWMSWRVKWNACVWDVCTRLWRSDMVLELLSSETKRLHFAGECHGKLQAITFGLRTKLPLNCIVNKRFALLLHDHADDDDGSKTSETLHKCIWTESAPTTKTQTFNFLFAVCSLRSSHRGWARQGTLKVSERARTQTHTHSETIP